MDFGDASSGDIVENAPEVSQRPQSIRMPPARLQDCEVTVDNEVTKDGDFVHFALLADVEPINHHETLKNALMEELEAIERNHTWGLSNYQPTPKQLR